MRKIEIFDKEKQRLFDSPPVLTQDERKIILLYRVR